MKATGAKQSSAAAAAATAADAEYLFTEWDRESLMFIYLFSAFLFRSLKSWRVRMMSLERVRALFRDSVFNLKLFLPLRSFLALMRLKYFRTFLNNTTDRQILLANFAFMSH